jgi:hypothetical protein
VSDAYERAGGAPVTADALVLFALRWDLADLAVATARLRRPHDGSEDDAASLALLRRILDGVVGRDGARR